MRSKKNSPLIWCDMPLMHTLFDIDDVPECNFEVGYTLDVNHGYYDEVGYAGSAQNCYQLARLKNPEANAIVWYSDFKSCYAVTGATKLVEAETKFLYAKENAHSCIFKSKIRIYYYTIRLRKFVFLIHILIQSISLVDL